MGKVSPAASPPAIYLTLEEHLTHDRLAPYLQSAAGNYKHAVKLYQWNVALSGAVYEALHVFEVVLRNAIDKQLAQWNVTQLDTQSQPRSAGWLKDPAPLLARLVGQEDLEKARSRAVTALGKKRLPMHSDLVAQTTFGTWRFMLPDKDPGRQFLWVNAVRFAFPNLIRRPEDVTSDVDGVYTLRNRVAHLEPILNGGVVKARHDAMRRVLGEISVKAEQWYVSNQRVTTALASRPAP